MKTYNLLWVIVIMYSSISFAQQSTLQENKEILERKFPYFVVSQNLVGVLSVLSNYTDLYFNISANIENVKVSSTHKGERVRDFIAHLEHNYGLIFYFSNGIMHVYDRSDVKERFFNTGFIEPVEVIEELKKIGIYSHRFPVKYNEDSMSSVYVSAPENYLNLVKSVIDTLRAKKSTSNQGTIEIIHGDLNDE
jgi:type II secretory pathway component GspD/PulD (secretin)